MWKYLSNFLLVLTAAYLVAVTAAAYTTPPNIIERTSRCQQQSRRRSPSASGYTPSHLRSSSSANDNNESESVQLQQQSDDKHPHASDEKTTSTRLIFPGGGLFFYWQAGAINYLRTAGYDLSKPKMSGASAGALVATLAATNVDFNLATKMALDLAEEGGVWTRPLGLQGVWGSMIETWLDDLLPENAAELCTERVSLLVTPVPSFGKTMVSHFESKEELIKCNMASVHIPWFLDGKLTSNFQNKAHIDGSFLASAMDYLPKQQRQKGESLISLDWQKDPIMAEKASDFVKVISKEGIWGMVEQGKSYARLMEDRGDFESLSRL